MQWYICVINCVFPYTWTDHRVISYQFTYLCSLRLTLALQQSSIFGFITYRFSRLINTPLFAKETFTQPKSHFLETIYMCLLEVTVAANAGSHCLENPSRKQPSYGI